MSSGHRGRSPSARRSGRRRWHRAPLAVVGAVGAVGLAVVYFWDPLEGPRRRREVVEWLQGTSREAWRLSQDIVARVIVVPEPAEQAEQAEPAWREPEPAEDLETALRDEVTFVTVRDPEPAFHASRPEPELERVPVGVAAVARAEALEGVAGPAPAVSYLSSESPKPTIIAYDTPRDEPSISDDTVVEKPEPGPDAAARSGGLGRGWVAAAAAIVLAVGAAALGAWALVATDDDPQVAAPAIPSGAAEAIELISEGARSIPVEGSQGTMVLVAAPDGRAALVISGLEKAPPGKEYQAWVVKGKSAPTSAGLFKGGETRLVVPLNTRVPEGAIVAVTVEVEGGAPAPTQQPRYTVQRA
jgi:hypothetical protein